MILEVIKVFHGYIAELSSSIEWAVVGVLIWVQQKIKGNYVTFELIVIKDY